MNPQDNTETAAPGTCTLGLDRKYTLTIREAAMYFNIGEKKLRSMISNDPNASFVLWNGTRALIKRGKFEKFIDDCNAI